MNIRQLKSFLVERNSRQTLLFALPVAALAGMFWLDLRDATVEPGQAIYMRDVAHSTCQPNQLNGNADEAWPEASEYGINHMLRSPENNDVSIPHPLLLVFSPTGAHPAKTEKMTGYPLPGTRTGFFSGHAGI